MPNVSSCIVVNGRERDADPHMVRPADHFRRDLVDRYSQTAQVQVGVAALILRGGADSNKCGLTTVPVVSDVSSLHVPVPANHPRHAVKPNDVLLPFLENLSCGLRLRRVCSLGVLSRPDVEPVPPSPTDDRYRPPPSEYILELRIWVGRLVRTVVRPLHPLPFAWDRSPMPCHALPMATDCMPGRLGLSNRAPAPRERPRR